MGKGNFREEFKRYAVTQITERGYPVADVAPRLGASQHSLHSWKKSLRSQLAATRRSPRSGG